MNSLYLGFSAAGVCLAGSLLAGYWTASPLVSEAASSPSAGAVVAAAAKEGIATMDAARPVPISLANTSHLPEGFIPDESDRKILAMTPRELASSVRTDLRAEIQASCRERLPRASTETCNRVFEATAEVAPKFLEVRQQLLRGEMDSATYQKRWHQLFLERQLALESVLSYDEKLSFDEIAPGSDTFLVLTNWGADVPVGFKLGLEEPPSSGWTGEPSSAPGKAP